MFFVKFSVFLVSIIFVQAKTPDSLENDFKNETRSRNKDGILTYFSKRNKIFYEDICLDLKKAENDDSLRKNFTQLFRDKYSAKSKGEFNKKIREHAQVPAKKFEGAVRGTGLDEVFQISKIGYFLDWSLGRLSSKEKESFFKDSKESFNVLHLQQYLRFPIAYQIYKNGNGHTGALYGIPKSKEVHHAKGALVNGQAEAHNIRHQKIMESSTPRKAALRAIRADLEFSPSYAELKANKTFKDEIIFSVATFDFKNRDISDDNKRAEFALEYAVTRDGKKRLFKRLKEKTFDSTKSEKDSVEEWNPSECDFSSCDEDKISITKPEDIARLIPSCEECIKRSNFKDFNEYYSENKFLDSVKVSSFEDFYRILPIDNKEVAFSKVKSLKEGTVREILEKINNGGVTQIKIGQVLGVSQSTVSRFLNGCTSPKLFDAFKKYYTSALEKNGIDEKYKDHNEAEKVRKSLIDLNKDGLMLSDIASALYIELEDLCNFLDKTDGLIENSGKVLGNFKKYNLFLSTKEKIDLSWLDDHY